MAYVGNQNYAVGDIVFVKKVAKRGTLRALGSFGTILEMELWFLADQLQVLL